MLVAAFVALCLSTMRVKSTTFDEPTYLGAGYASVTTDLELNPAHPPLMKYLFAVPLALVGSAPVTEIPNWGEAILKPRTFGLSFLFENRVEADTLLFAARSTVVVVSVALALLVAAWAHQLYGPVAGLVALGLYAFCPNLIAHSTVATLDLGVTAGITAASYAFWRACRRPSARTGAVAGVALGIALLMKATALLLLAVFPLELAAANAWHRRSTADAPRHAGGERKRGRKRAPVVASGSAGPLLVAAAVAVLVALALVAVAYGPRHFGLTSYVASLRHGILNRAAYMTQGYQAFCWGRYSAEGFRWYFLAAFLLKTPVPTLVMTAATIVWLARRRLVDWFDELFLVLPIVAVFVATAFSNDDLGLRYILPVYPLLYVLLGGMAASVVHWTQQQRAANAWRSRAGALGAATLALAYGGGTLAVHPNHLAFFNGLFAGPGDGIRYLDDSNVDWGQDYKQLARYVHAHGLTGVKGLYHPYHVAPYVARYYGLTLQPPTFAEVRTPMPGWYAISAHLLQRPSLAEDPAFGTVRFDWLERFTPVAKIGYSIYVYHFE